MHYLIGDCLRIVGRDMKFQTFYLFPNCTTNPQRLFMSLCMQAEEGSPEIQHRLFSVSLSALLLARIVFPVISIFMSSKRKFFPASRDERAATNTLMISYTSQIINVSHTERSWWQSGDCSLLFFFFFSLRFKGWIGEAGQDKKMSRTRLK